MIQNFDYFTNGELQNASIHDVFTDVIDRVRDKLCDFELEKPDTTKLYERQCFTRKTFCRGMMSLNSKNIEATFSNHLTDYVMDNKLKSHMDRLGLGDVLVQLVIYRLGAYSYYLTQCTALFNTPSKDPNAEPITIE